jgi:alginate O-acetyltransferase complex protein AlgJ
MPTNDSPAPLNQTQIDHLELASTEISPRTAKLFSLVFAAVLFAVPLSQALVEIRQSQLPQALEVFQPFVSGLRLGGSGDFAGMRTALLDGVRPDTLHGYEDTVEDRSIFQAFFQPRTQQWLTGWLGAGNDKVVLGRGGWMFYLPGLDYVAGPSVADAATFDRAAQEMVNKGTHASPQPDPRPALLDLHRQSREAGIHLIVVPLPDKVMMQPAQLSLRSAGASVLPVANNAGYQRLAAEMRAAGVDWFDPAPRQVRSDDIRYLAQDTHWTPDYMDAVARDVAAHVHRAGLLSAAPVPLRLVPQTVSRVGDLVDLLKLTKDQTLFAPQTVMTQQVLDERSGQPVAWDREAEVLLLGDSFTNIYSAQGMGWRTGAGFGQHLAYHLQRPIDAIAFNGGGASVRTELARQPNAARLGFKKVIVYAFAIRSLLSENWEPVSMVTPERPVR